MKISKNDSNPDIMKNINDFWRQLTKKEISGKVHREMVGGYWDEIGTLQCNFLKDRGLLPKHKFVDVGCGAFRGGVHFIDYLDTGNYYGLDINESLIEAGLLELKELNLQTKNPNVLINSQFNLSFFNTKFDYGIAQSLFTHLLINNILRCLVEVSRVLKPDGKFYATFFEAPSSVYLDRLVQNPGNTVTNYDSDPFHYSYEEFEMFARLSGLNVELIGDWDHPRNQKMLRFTLPKQGH